MIDKQLCSGCGACACVCNFSCLSMQSDKKGFLYPQINSDLCRNCKLCEKVCPILNRNTPNQQQTAYAVQNKNENIRLCSSSGGFFTLLAEYVLNRNGIIFGAGFNSNMLVEHIAIYNETELNQLRGSKYVQSSIGNTYIQAKQLLLSGKLVLFTGTPCQIEGLLKYLGQDFENLITMDFICHGVSSPEFWENYLNYHERKHNSKIKNAFFRDKKRGWMNFSMHLNFENSKKVYYPKGKDLFLRAYLSNFILRESCYQCSFKQKFHPSDFTIADFWKVDQLIAELNDDKGTSLVLLNSRKSVNIFDEIKKKAFYHPVDANSAIGFNSAMTKAVDCPEQRNNFFTQLENSGIKKAVNTYCPTDYKLKRIYIQAVKKIHKILRVQK